MNKNYMPKSSHERKHHHAKEKTQGGFISNNFRNTMNKNEKIIMGVLVGGIVMFLILSIVVLFGKGGKLTTQNSTEQEVPASEKVKVLTTPYPTTPPITDFFMQVNEKRFYPDTVMIKKGHSVTIMNIGKSVTTVTPSVADSDHDFGEIKESEEKVIQFNKAGVYRYTRSTKPDQVLTITVTE